MSVRSVTSRIDGLPAAASRVRTWAAAQRWWLAALFAIALAWHISSWVSLSQGFLNPLFNDATRRLGQGSDFFAVYHAGEHFRHNESLYVLKEGAFPPYPFAYSYRYLPSVAYTVGAPLSLLSPWVAYWTWLAFNELLLAINLVLTWRSSPTPALRWLCCSMWLLFTPLYLEFYMGQFSFVMASLLFWTGLALATKTPIAGGASWAVSLVVKTNSLVLAPLWLRMRAYRVVVGGLAFAALLNVPYFLLKPGSLGHWLDNFSGVFGGAPIDTSAGSFGLRNFLAAIDVLAEQRGGVVLNVLARIAEPPVWAPAIAAVSLVATFAQRRFDPVTSFAVWCTTYFLIYTDVWEHHYVMLLPTLVLLVMRRPQFAAIALVTYVLVALPTPYWLFERLERDPAEVRSPLWSDPQHAWTALEILVNHLTKVLPTLLLWAVLVRSSLREADWRQLRLWAPAPPAGAASNRVDAPGDLG